MSYPPPPGTGNLPARPPPPSTVSAPPSSGGFSKGGFKSAFSQPAQTSYGAAPTYGPSRPPPASTRQNAPPPSRTSYASPATSVNAPPTYSQPPSQQSYAQSYGPQSYAPQSYGPQSHGPRSYAGSAGPQIKNPFPTAAGTGSDFDPEMAAQIAQWQSAYGPRPTDEQGDTVQMPQQQQQQPVVDTTDPDKKKTVVREGGGKKWTDDTLLEWDPSHLRLFVGNLAGETTDDSLLKAFSRWSSVQKARVIRDKRTSKSKGYGFVSFSNADDFFSAAKEMNGKYIQSHPVVVRKANTEIKVASSKDNGRGGKKNKGGRDKRNGGNGGGGYDAHLGPHGGGVTKPGQKTRNGLKLLG